MKNQKDKNNPFYGKHHTEETKLKMRKRKLGKKRNPFTEATKKKMSLNTHLRKDGRTLKKYYCIDCGKEIHFATALYGQGRCPSCAKIFEKNPNFKNGKVSLALQIRDLQNSEIWRKQIFKRDEYTCQDCGQYGGQLEAHHKISFTKLLSEFLQEYDQFSPIEDKETLVRLAIKWQLFWDIENGKTLCKKCHKKISTRRI